EPTSGVDPIFRRKFWEILYGLADKGITIFITTHYMDEANYCQRISIMHLGKIIEIGNPLKLVEKYQKDNLEDLFISLIKDKAEADV
ncbi:MAG: ABC transporter ATP-binding protein, partial [FCB group bacterium]|nr:ABC transporter ATP-binding protein [FCB group bacterium]